MSDSVSLHEAAGMLDVHYMTAYRYVRTGRLPGHQVNGQWRVERADVESFRSDPPRGRPGRSPSGERAWEGRFYSQLISGDEAGAWTVAQDALASGLTPAAFYRDVVVPALRTIGEAWESGEVSVAQEHRASVIVQRIVGRMGPLFVRRGRKRGLVVVGCPAGERHSLPNALVADMLRSHNFSVSDLGADVPTADFVALVAEARDLVAVCISVTMSMDPDLVGELIRRLHESVSVPVLLGGAGVASESEAQSVGADIWTGSSETDLGWIDQIPRLSGVATQDSV